MPLSIGAVTKLDSVMRIEFLGLTKAGLDDSDGERLASALSLPPRFAPPRAALEKNG